MRTGWLSGAAVIAVTLVSTGEVQGQSSTYLDFDGLTRSLKALADGSSDARMRSIGMSHQGRDVWLIEIGSSSGTPFEERPGVLVVGNLEGDDLVGSQLALESARFLLNDSSAKSVLTEQVVYIVPRLNPDGAEAMFDRVRWGRRGNSRAFDDDNDGRVDEDPPEDLNGDGVITLMRVPDPRGEFIVDADDARLMKRADKTAGESGTHSIYVEGVDSDGDGFVNEDGLGGVDLNRNFQHAYPYWASDAGPHMVSEPETRALMDFMVRNENIGAVLAFGYSDNLVTPPDNRGELAGSSTIDLNAFGAEANADVFEVGVFGDGNGRQSFGFGGGGRTGARGAPLRGAQPGRDNDPQSGRRPAVVVNEEDREYFKAVSDAYREITGITQTLVNRKAEGAFFQMAYFQRGIPAFSTQGWGVTDGMIEGKSLDAKLLAWAESGGVDLFRPWTAYEHPDFGTVEIGGFAPYATTNPPASELPELGRRHGAFVVRLAGMLPHVRVVNTDVVAHGGGVYTVSAEIENSGYFPTSLEQGVVSRSVAATLVRIQVDPDALLTGDAKSSSIQKLDGSGSRAEFSWVIRGRAGQKVDIWVRSEHGGTDTATVTLR